MTITNYINQIEYIVKHVDTQYEWMKIKGDNAFTDIIKGWIESDRETYYRHLKKTEIVVQAGGYCGIFPRLLSKQFEVVYTFEPDPLNFFCLVNNCQHDNIIKMQAALGRENQLVAISRTNETNRGMNRVVENVPNALMPVIKIDSLKLPTCDFIQLDTEGYEYNILVGAMITIEKYKPVISVEDTNTKIEDFLLPIGYKKVDQTHRDTIYAV